MVKDPQSVNKMQSEPQMPFDEIKPSNQKHRLLQQLLPYLPQSKLRSSEINTDLVLLVSTYRLIVSSLINYLKKK
ncbi:hypothetical protein DPMN_043685 [Dreissena polymorpha]|uniref:Uncharacterized protein n=1 Tax=Dreissena polymorpha TaxID=45954 RepID=A0A9D4HY31_DREPO|nr:hypothetical protein DPMN_043685 [Dreissena polymorpha]